MRSVHTLSGDFFGWGEGLRGWGYVGGTFHGGICQGEKLHEGGAGFFSIFFKEQWKVEHEKVFSTESKEQH